MKKLIYGIFISITAANGLLADGNCMRYIKAAYDTGYSNYGGYANYQEAEHICKSQLKMFVFNGYPGTFEACMIGIDRDFTNKDITKLYLQYCK